jgi:hypothetical protein
VLDRMGMDELDFNTGSDDDIEAGQQDLMNVGL